MNKQTSPKTILIIGLVFLIGGLITAGVTLLVSGSPIIIIFSGIFTFTGLIITIVGMVQLSQRKAIDARMNDPSSMANKTYGGSGNYEYCLAYPDKDKQEARKAVANTVGAIGIIFGAGGVITTGLDSVDVFVSPDEIIINDKKRNSLLEDELFRKIPVSTIDEITVKSGDDCVKVVISIANVKKPLILDIPVKYTNGYDFIQQLFTSLKPSKNNCK